MNKAVPALQTLKFEHFGHDLIILHEHEIRKQKGDFKQFRKNEKMAFTQKLSQLIENSNFILTSCVIEKAKIQHPENVENAYHIALKYCLETLYDLLSEKGQQHKITHVVVEERGKKEDRELELAFRRVCDGYNKHGESYKFSLRMASKKSNSTGLQFADLVTRPIGRHVLNPEQTNRAFDILKLKLFCEGGRSNLGANYRDWGLKHFP